MKKILFPIVALAILASCQSPNTNSQESSPAAAEEPAQEEVNTNQPPAVPEGARVYFANLNDGDTVSSPVYVEFGIEGMEVEPAGNVNAGMGHHHIIINNSFIEMGGTVPADSVNIHYGGGQVSDSLDLNPGNYQLTMQFADGFHRSYGQQMSATISIVVE